MILLNTIGRMNCIMDVLRVVCKVRFRLILCVSFRSYEYDISSVKYTVTFFGPYLVVK